MHTKNPTGTARTLWRQRSFWLVILLGALYAWPQTVRVDSKSGAQSSPLLGTGQRVTVNTDLVTMTITVQDKQGNNILGLQKQAFSILDDKVPQKIRFFTDADAPVSIGILFDVSGSMTGAKTERARQALARFVQTSDRRDDYFLIAFNSRANMLIDRTHDADALLRTLRGVRADGDTALYDAVYLGAEKLQRGEQPKRVLLVITDGRENSSRHSFKEVHSLLEESDLLVYSICVLDPIQLTGKAGAHVQNTLNRLSDVTGGRAFYPENVSQMDEVFDRIALELRHQYSIGYKPRNFNSDGQWHRIKIKVEPPRGYSHLVVRSRDGYFASHK